VKITFLGTGTSQGVPIIGCKCEVCSSPDSKDKRLRSSVLIETDTTTFVIDTGPDFRQQMLRENVQKMDAIVFTHGHKDHTAGFDDIRGFNYLQKKAMEVYGDFRVEQVLKRDFYYVFEENKYPGVPDVNLHIFDNKPFKVGAEEVIPIEVLHYKLPVFGFRVRDFTYITDANYISEEEKDKIRGSKVLVLNALRRSAHISHFTLEQAIALAEELEIPEVYFTHISHQLGLHKEVDLELPAHIKLAYDGLSVEI
jgi:phosphoribosyl 1,2-cyclic phosphate phosphodiesterase